MGSLGKILEHENCGLVQDNALTIPSVELQQEALDALLYDSMKKAYSIMQEGSFEEQIKVYNSLIAHSRLIEQRRMNTASDRKLEIDDPNLVLGYNDG